MSIEQLLMIGLGIFLGSLALLQIYLAYRIRKYKQDSANTTDPTMTAKETFRFGLFHTLFYTYMILFALYYTWIGKFSNWLGVGLIIVGLVSIRKPLKLVTDHLPMHADQVIFMPLMPRSTHIVTPELIQEVLENETVVNAIRTDLLKVRQIGSKEQWRLGLLTSDTDIYNQLFQIPLKRAAIIHPTSFFNTQFDRVLISHGTKPLPIQSYPGWTYRLATSYAADQTLRDIQIDTNSPYTRNRSARLANFLREDGFPVRDSYFDGDPLTAERGGTFVLDQGKIKLIYSDYFVQSRLIDEEGNLVYMGIDENFAPSSTWLTTPVVPSVSKKLFKSVEYEGYAPILRYRSFPYTSNFMLPILDTPMSDSGWADLFIDSRGRAKLFIAKQKTLAEWYEMMGKLRQLFFGELEKKGNHLLGLTKDPQHLNEYFSRKQLILAEYFIIMDWSMKI